MQASPDAEAEVRAATLALSSLSLDGDGANATKETTVVPPPADTTAEETKEEAEDERAEDTRGRAPRPYLEIDTGLEAEADVSPRCPDRKISLDLTPLSCKSNDSAAEYYQPDQTIIIFDWDDTLCPSTTCMRHHGLNVLGPPPEGELRESLQVVAQEVQLLIERACELASKVVVVTNAEEGWVDLSCKAWLPSLQETISRCEVASARSTWEPRGVASPAGWKSRTFEDLIDRFYSRYPHQSWKNILSVGDAPHEREALSRVVRWAPQGRGRCRSKSVKFVLRPSVQQLTRELQMLRESLREIVLHDDDLDLHFSAESLTEPLITSPSSDA